MITWLTFSQLMCVWGVIRTLEQRHAMGTLDMATSVAGVVVFVIPAIYTVGWLLLPAWGVGR